MDVARNGCRLSDGGHFLFAAPHRNKAQHPNRVDHIPARKNEITPPQKTGRC